MTLRISDLNNSTYASVAEHRQELAQAGNDRDILEAIEAKFKRSWETLKDTPGAQHGSPGKQALAVQVLPDGRMAYGDPGFVASARNEVRDANSERSAQTKDGLQRFMKVQVRR